MKVSVIIPYFNDYEMLVHIMPALLDGIPNRQGEIIIIDNGSHSPLGVIGRDKLRIIRNERNIGVGAAFNQGVEMARADRIVFMGADVIAREGWFDRVIQTLDHSPKTIFSCTSTDFEPENPKARPFRPRAKRRYGAHILYKMNRDDLSDGHKDKNDEKFHKILQAKWNEYFVGDEVMRVESILGAFYWMRREDFQQIHGWNGHFGWGSLEPFLSIKARAHGMKLMVDKKLEAAHYFGRKVIRGSRPDLQYYNMLFMAHTMFSEALRDELIEYLECGDTGERLGRLNVNQAKQMISRYKGLVQAERDYNNKNFRHGLISNWEKFNSEMI